MSQTQEKSIKVAIVADPIFRFGGAEKVLEAIIEMYPRAHLFTLFIAPEPLTILTKRYPNLVIHTSPFQLLIRGDRISRYVSAIKVISWIWWELLNLGEFDLVISSSHSYMAKNVKVPKEAVHISYVHTPPRYLYDEYSEIGWIRAFPFNLIFSPLRAMLRRIDQMGAQRPNEIVVNSKNVKNRVLKYYRRDSRIIYPNVEAKRLTKQEKGDYYVFLSRLVKQKGPELAVETCTHHNLPLIVMGDGDEYERLKRIAGNTVKFIRAVSEEEKYQVLGGAKALLYTSIDEDFGIVPVEALKSGVPVIAYNSGGVRETVIDGVNGVLFEKRTEKSLHQAILKLDKLKIEASECIRSAGKYSRENFQKGLLVAIREQMQKNRNYRDLY